MLVHISKVIVFEIIIFLIEMPGGIRLEFHTIVFAEDVLGTFA